MPPRIQNGKQSSKKTIAHKAEKVKGVPDKNVKKVRRMQKKRLNYCIIELNNYDM
jgi:hypothetical protein